MKQTKIGIGANMAIRTTLCSYIPDLSCCWSS